MRNSGQLEDPSPARPEDAATGATRGRIGGAGLLLGALCVSGITNPIRINHNSNKGAPRIITYEAEKAFKHVKGDISSCQVKNGAFSHLGDQAYTIFSVFAPSDGVYRVTLHAVDCDDSKKTMVDIQVNGLPAVSFEEVVLRRNATIHRLPLRTGLNTITYKLHGGSLSFDAISIEGGLMPADRGATIPYDTLEAEDATTTGVVIGPNRTYTSIPSESSGKKAVQIQGSQTIVFVTKSQFNAFVIRFSIPNTPNGQGQAAPLHVKIGDADLTLNVTSFYSYAYGNYPFSRNPGEGRVHHFYDDVRYFFTDRNFPAGTKVQVSPGDASIKYTIDLLETWNVGPAYTQPSGSLSVLNYGADNTGKKDSLQAFQQAIQASTQQKTSVWIPAGTYTFSQRISLGNGVTIRGAGWWYTNLHGNDFGFFGQWGNPSQDVHLYDFAIVGRTNHRDDGEISSGAGGSYTSSTIQGVWIEHNKCGMWLDGPFDHLHITGVIIRNTFADGINFHKGITDSMVEQAIIRNVGDDALAMWAEQPNTYGRNTFQFNTLSLPILANLIGIYGGSDNSATDNLVYDNIVEGAGIQAGTRYNSVPLAGTTTFARNTLIRTGSFDIYNANSKGEGALWLFADNGPVTQGSILFQDITVTDSLYSAIMFYQGQNNNINFTNIQVDGAVYLFEERNPGGAYVQGVTAINLSGAGTWICPNLAHDFKITQGPGNNYPSTVVQGNC